jgi:geranylgeranyl diphosphate synthase type I
MNVKKQLVEFREELNPFLEKYFVKKRDKYQGIDPVIEVSLDIMEDFTMRGGKRLRPALLYNSYKMFGGKKQEEIIQVSMFIEIIQSFLLIHDDIFDNDDLRRGKITVHKFFEKYAGQYDVNDKKRFGEVLGILNGDLANQFVFDILTDSSLEDSIKVKIAKETANLISKVLVGQILDYVGAIKDTLDWSDLEKIYKNKTSTYTYELPLVAGAIIAGIENGETFEKLRKFAFYSGIAFQLRDDILGLFGTEEKLGKNIASDVEEGKRTLLVIQALNNCDAEQAKTIHKLLGQETVNKEELEVFRSIVIDTGALEYTEKKCKDFSAKAQDIFETIEYKDEFGWKFIHGVVEYMSNKRCN